MWKGSRLEKAMLSLTEEVLWGSDNNTRSLPKIAQRQPLLGATSAAGARDPCGVIGSISFAGPWSRCCSSSSRSPSCEFGGDAGTTCTRWKDQQDQGHQHWVTGVIPEAFTDEELMTDQVMKPAEQGSGLQGQHSVGLTLQKLTSIVELLTEDKKKRTAQSKLETALDGSAAASSDVPVHGTGKKAAAARQALRSADDDVDDDDDARSGTMAAELGLEPRLR